MGKSSTIGLTGFGLSYVLLGLLAAWGLDAAGWDSAWVDYLLTNVMAAACAVVVGLGIGRLTIGSVAICSLAMQLVALLASIALLAAIPYRGGYAVDWPRVLGFVLTPDLALSLTIGTISPVIWLLVFRRVAPRLAAVG